MRQKSELRDAQQRTITRLVEFDETQAILPMGAGKTASALTAFTELVAMGEVKHMFVLAPKRVAQLVWAPEARIWAHLKHLKVIFVGGSKAQRERAMATTADVHVIGIDNVQWFVDYIMAASRGGRSLPYQVFDIIAFDELSRWKNPRGKRAKAIYPLMQLFKLRWGLTGTPRPNGYEDQFMPMKLLTRGKLWGQSYDKWHQANFMPLDFNGYRWTILPHRRTEILADINKVSITIRAEDMPDMPELNDGPDYVEWVDMPPDVMPVYHKMKEHLVVMLKSGTIAAANMAVASGKLEQIANGFLYEDGDLDALKRRVVTRLHDVKMDRLLDMLEEVGGEPVMIPYQFKEDLDRLQIEFPGLPYFGAGVSDAKAAENERAWNDGRLPLLAVHPASAAHGLNLQYGGRQVFWYGFGWSAELYDQLLKRLHRPGQVAPVFSRPILMRGTVDEVKYERARNKISEQQAFNRLINEA